MSRRTELEAMTHFQLGLIAVAGIVALALAWRGSDLATDTVRACYAGYGALFVIGTVAYYALPRVGSALLVASLLSAVVVMPLVGLPVWADAPIASRVGMIIGALVAAAIVCGPLLEPVYQGDDQ